MSDAYPPTIGYCTDEDLAIRCPTDIGILTPAASVMTAGVDGAVSIEDPWTLISSGTDFEAQGVKAGGLIQLAGGGIRGSGYHVVIDAVAGPTLTLRRIGQLAGVGQPIGTGEPLAGVKFSVSTLAPQIEQASDEMNRRFGIDPLSAFRGPTALYDLRELREVTMLTVLLRQYTNSTRTGEGDFAFKVRELEKSLDAALARVQVRWGPRGDDGPPSDVFGMRIARG